MLTLTLPDDGRDRDRRWEVVGGVVSTATSVAFWIRLVCLRRGPRGETEKQEPCLPCLLLERLEALAVDDRGTALVVLLLGDPHLLEGGERGQDGAADPD